MSLESQLAAVQQMIGMVDAWVSAATAEVRAALQAQIDAINAAADAQIEAANAAADAQIEAVNAAAEAQTEAINAQIEALNDQMEAAQEARDAVAEQYQDQIDAINETLEALQDWIQVAENLQNMIDSIKYSTANPVPLPGQLSAMQTQIAAMWQQFLGAAPEDQAGLADELAAMLQQYLQLAGQVYQVPTAEYQDIYTYVMDMLNQLQAIAQAKADVAKSTVIDSADYAATKRREAEEDAIPKNGPSLETLAKMAAIRAKAKAVEI
jgi:DNA repair exonuclease SbcCD ATPase subunit